MNDPLCPVGWHYTGSLVSVGLPSAHEDARIVRAAVAIADAVCGLGSSGSAERQSLYEGFLYPYDTRQHAAWLADRQSSCALHCRALCDRLGLEHRLIDSPYWGRNDAVSNIVQIGRDCGGWVDATRPDAEFPSIGCVALVGNNGSEGLEHVFFIDDEETVADENGDVLVSVSTDGGQPDNPGYSIQRRRRVYDRKLHPGQIWARGVDGPGQTARNPGPGRRLRGYFHVSGVKALLTQPALLPDSFE